MHKVPSELAFPFSSLLSKPVTLLMTTVWSEGLSVRTDSAALLHLGQQQSQSCPRSLVELPLSSVCAPKLVRCVSFGILNSLPLCRAGPNLGLFLAPDENVSFGGQRSQANKHSILLLADCFSFGEGIIFRIPAGFHPVP